MFSEGQRVRFIGQCQELQGKTGTFAAMRDYDLYCGTPLGLCPGFLDADGNGYYVELDELEAA
jgi:hypothetical protein